MSTAIISDSNSDVTRAACLFTRLVNDDFRPMELCVAILLALATHTWRRQKYSPRRLQQVIQLLRVQLRRDSWLMELAASSRIDLNDLLVRAQISFWAFTLGIPVEQVCGWWDDPRLQPLSRAMGQRGVCHPQRMAEFHQRIGQIGRTHLQRRCKEILCHHLNLCRLTEDDLTQAIAAHTFEPLALEIGRTYGFSYFLNFVYWQGVFAQIECALTEPLKPNGYSLRELVAGYFRRFDTGTATPEALAEELRNHAWRAEDEVALTPCSQTFRNLLAKLVPDRIIALQEQQARRALRPKCRIKGARTRLAVAVDATLLQLFGKFQGQERLFDHVTQQSILGYKLYVVFELSTRQPLAFVLHDPTVRRADGQPKGDADYLDDLVEKAKHLLGVEHLAYILFDKGFWSQAEFKALVDRGETPVTPGKQFKTITTVLTAIPDADWLRVGRNERIAERQVTFDNGLTLRLIVWKKLGQKVVRDAQGKPKHDKHGKTIYRAAPILYTYVTNIAADAMEPDQVVALYGQRWGIEDFFEQMDNQLVWGRLPGTKLEVVRVHIALSLLGYILLMEFKHLVAAWMNQAEYATMELRRFARVFLRAPVTLLAWLKTRRPGQRQPHRRLRHRSFIASLAAFGKPG